MTKQEAARRNHMFNALQSLGFTYDECEKLRRISMTLRRWHELECGTDNGCVERDEGTGKAYWLNAMTGKRYPIADRETGARKRLKAILWERNERVANGNTEYTRDAEKLPVDYYVQGDPRGAALYLLRIYDIPKGMTADSCYSRGICVY